VHATGGLAEGNTGGLVLYGYEEGVFNGKGEKIRRARIESEHKI